MPSFSKIASFLSLATLGFAATPIPDIIGLAVTGSFDGCSVDTATDYQSGGSITVDGWTIKVPKNLLVQFPVRWVPFGELCGSGSGGFEISVLGNVVQSEARAAQIFVSPGFSLRAGNGYIESINIPDGSFKIRGGPTLRLADPTGKFGKVQDPAPFFPVDDQNPSITAFSGFPMCIPRSDSDTKCPSSNRPSGTTNFDAPDPLAMVPLQVGDYINYAGQKVGGEIAVFELAADNVQVTTKASDTVPNYIRVEDAIIGVFDSNGNVESADYRFIGYLSSCAGATVKISAIDVNPCTGEQVFRQITTATPKNGDVRCKWEARANAGTAIEPYTREYVVTVNSPVVETKDGIKGGQYITPVTEWIQPEIAVPGAEARPYLFDKIRGLVNGDNLDDKQYGPLSPFPGADPPAPSACSGSPSNPGDSGTPTANGPVAFAAPISAVQRVGAQIALVASNNNSAILNSDLVYAWSKTAPEAATVSISNAAQPTATIVAPQSTVPTNYTFEVTVSLKSNSSLTSKANVTVQVSPTALDIVTVDTYSWASKNSGTLSVTCSSNVVNGDNKRMNLLLNNGATNLTMTAGTGAGKWTYTNTKIKQPTNVQCVSNIGGKSALATAPFRRRKRGLLGVLTDIL